MNPVLRTAALAALLLAALAAPALAESTTVTVYKSPTCGCCTKWIDHLEANGFEVSAVDVDETWPIKQKHGVPAELAACHTAVVDGYVVEGHVPAADVARLLRERPEVKGIAVPDMPLGSPGMEASDPSRHERYQVLSFDAEGKTKVFESHGP